MLARHHLLRGLVAALVLAVLQGGCLGACGECNDCGECGLVGGPSTSTELRGGAVGLDGMVPTAEVLLLREGACPGIDDERIWLGWDDGTVLAREPEEDDELSEAGAEANGARRFGSVTIRVAASDGAIRVTFNPEDADEDVVIACSLDAELGVVCGPP